MVYAQQKLGITERQACAALGQSRSVQRHAPKRADDEAALTADILALARQYVSHELQR